MTRHRTIIIGLDGGAPGIVNPLVEAGILPTFARMTKEGAHGILRAWPDTNCATSWTSIMTGCGAGRHAVHDASLVASRGGTAWRSPTAPDRREIPFWQMLEEAGQRAGIINLPVTFPAGPMKGFMIAGSESPSVRAPGFSYPGGLVDELNRAGIEYVLDIPSLKDSSRADPYSLPASVERMIDGRARSVLQLMDSREWEVMMAVFVAPDRVQHYHWPGNQTGVEGDDWGPVRRVYERLDRFLGDVLSRIDSGTTVLVVSDHGFIQDRGAKRQLSRLFERLGLLSHRTGKGRAGSGLLRALLVHGRRIIPYALQKPLARAMPSLHLRAVREHRFAGIDWSRSSAYPNPDGDRVSINLRGREVQGLVAPEAYGEARERVRDILLGLTDANSGAPVVRGVHRREEVYQGPCTEGAADLIIEWDYDVLDKSLCYEENGERIVVEAGDGVSEGGYGWSGSHQADGLFFARGPDIAGGTVVDAGVCDIAPTVLYLQGVPITRGMDGRVLTALFTEERLLSRPVGECETASSPTAV